MKRSRSRSSSQSSSSSQNGNNPSSSTLGVRKNKGGKKKQKAADPSANQMEVGDALVAPYQGTQESTEVGLKDVVCVVFSPSVTSVRAVLSKKNIGASIYLVDCAKQELRAFLHLNRAHYPSDMAFVGYKSKLYMFGGSFGDKETSTSAIFDGRPEAYVLDLLQLSKTHDKNEPKPLPTKISSMKAGKLSPMAWVLGEKICVYDGILGYKGKKDCCFELYDPEQDIWTQVPDPISFECGHLVVGNYVEGSKLFVSISDCRGIYELHLGASKPFWTHHDVFHGVDILPSRADGPRIGPLVVNGSCAFDLADDEGFGHQIKVCNSGDPVDKGYEIKRHLDGQIFKFGTDEVCIVCARYLRKPRCPIRLSPRFECHQEEEEDAYSYKLVLHVLGVECTARPIRLNIRDSFMVSMENDIEYYHGSFSTAFLCDH